MIEITIDTGDVPSVLAALADPKLADLAVKAAAEVYVDDMLDWIHAGKSFTGRSGQLEQSIGWRPVNDGAADVFAGAEYAGYVEFGTGPHVIRPRPGRKALRFPIAGSGFGSAREINHPGSKAHPFFFADRSNREANMQQRILSILAAQVDRARG